MKFINSLSLFFCFLLVTLFACQKEEQVNAPVITTTNVTEIAGSSASSGGNVTSDGGGSITARGVCWSTKPAPTTADDKTSDGTGTGSFASLLESLMPNTTYYVRAYATNEAGTSYGADVSFITNGLATVKTGTISNISTDAAKINATISSDGRSAIIAKGFCWSTSSEPTIANAKSVAESGTESFSSTLQDLKTGTTYYVRAYVTNAIGTAYGDVVSFTTDVVDVDGNVYKTVKIGTQIWIVENLKVTKYRNGDPIRHLTDNDEWQNSTSGAYCNHGNNSTNGMVYGRLYNYYALTDSRNVCPEGWRLPTNEDWKTLEQFLGGNQIAGGKMKEAGTGHWMSPNTGADNVSGFTALPAGHRGGGGFYSLGTSTVFWSNPAEKFTRLLSNDFGQVSGTGNSIEGGASMGYSIRCIKE